MKKIKPTIAGFLKYCKHKDISFNFLTPEKKADHYSNYIFDLKHGIKDEKVV